MHTFNPLTGEQKDYASTTTNKLVDYTLVSHTKGFQGNDMVIFASDNDVGVIQMVNYFTNTDSL